MSATQAPLLAQGVNWIVSLLSSSPGGGRVWQVPLSTKRLMQIADGGALLGHLAANFLEIIASEEVRVGQSLRHQLTF